MTASLPTTATSAPGAATTGGVGGARQGRAGFQKTLSAVADSLGTSTGALKKGLAAGKSLTEMASSAGVGKDDLVATIASTLSSTTSDGSAVDTTAMAAHIADSTRQAPPPRPSDAGRGTTAEAPDLGKGIDTLASALGISSDNLLQRLTDGSGIRDLLTSNPGVSTQLSVLQNKGALLDGYA